MAFGTKTNERPGTRAQLKYLRVSAYKAREVLDLIRGLHVDDADGVLEFTDRAVATEIRKVLASAVSNAEHNDEIDPNDLYVSACYADEGPTLKRWRPRARGRATRIRKRTCHITIIVSRMDAAKLEQRRARSAAAVSRGGVRRDAAQARRERVAKSRAARAEREAAHDHDHDHEHDHEHDDDLTDEVIAQAEADEPGVAEDNVEAAVEEAAAPQEDDVTTDEGLGAEPQASAPAGGIAEGGEAPTEAHDQQADEASTEAEES
jgi:large subunit ribosomal protein L22